MKDGGRPSGTGLQEQVSNQCMRLQLRVEVVSDVLNVGFNWQVTLQKTTAKESLMRCRNRIDDVKTRRLQFFGDRIQKLPVYCLGDIRHIDDVICSEAFIRNIGTCRSAVKGNVQMGDQKN